MKKRIPAIILMFVLFLTTSYAANTYRKTIIVTSGVNVEFNNEAIDMTDANGKAVEAFIYNGTTYVPIRAVSNAFGADIGYDRNTQTISIYDDFNEMATVAYKLNHNMYYCLSSADLWLDYIFANTPYDASEEISLQAQLLERNERMIETLREDNGNCGYLEDSLLGYYQDFVNQYNSLKSMYNTYSKNPQNTSALSSMVSYKSKMLTDYIQYGNDMEDLLDSFNWREFK